MAGSPTFNHDELDVILLSDERSYYSDETYNDEIAQRTMPIRRREKNEDNARGKEGRRHLIKSMRKLSPNISALTTDISTLMTIQDEMISKMNTTKAFVQELEKKIKAIKDEFDALLPSEASTSKKTEDESINRPEAHHKQPDREGNADPTIPSSKSKETGEEELEKKRKAIKDEFDELLPSEASPSKKSEGESMNRSEAHHKRPDREGNADSTIPSSKSKETGEGPSPNLHTEETLEIGTVDSMLKNTTVLYPNYNTMLMMRSYYERIDTLSSLTSCILKFLAIQPKVKITVDFYSDRITNIKPTFTDYHGEKQSGEHYRAFADFEESHVYVGMMFDQHYTGDVLTGLLVRSLTRMSMFLAFENGGIPYASQDNEAKKRYDEIIKEAVEKKDQGDKLDPYIHYALRKETKLSMEINLIAAVPGMIALYGLEDGTSRLKKQLPSLLDFYEKMVMPVLVSQASATSTS